MPREEWREGNRVHYKEYRVIGKETKVEEADKILDEHNVPVPTKKSVLKALEIFDGELVLISERIPGTERRRIVWSRNHGQG